MGENSDRELRSSNEIDWDLVGVYEHDTTSFTQGLLWHEGLLYESSGHYKQSWLRSWDLESGLVEAEVSLPDEIFAEGLVLVAEELFLLTWKERRLLRWSLPPFEYLGEMSYQEEGWGLAFDGESLIHSDGTARLRWRDPNSFQELRSVIVRREGEPQPGLNELEWAGGWVYANVWGIDEILRIDPQTGIVDGVIFLSGLLAPDERIRTDVLNGIAYREETNSFLVTGKYWPSVFEIQLRNSAD